MCNLNVHGRVEGLLSGTAPPPMISWGPNVHSEMQLVEDGDEDDCVNCDSIQIRNRGGLKDMQEIVDLRLLEQGLKGRN
jgi:hypothetical protein